MGSATGSDEARPDWRDRLLRTGAMVLSGLLMRAAVPDWDLWWLGFFFWLPWLWAIDGLAPRRAFRLGWLCGIAGIFVGYVWMTELLTRFAGMAMPAALGIHFLFSAWQGLGFGLSALAVTVVQRRTGRDVLWVMPLAWATFEALLPALFPTYLALGWCWQPRWIQLAELGGVTTVTFAMAAINSALYLVIKGFATQRKLDTRAAIALGAWLVGVPAYGTVRMAQIDAAMDAAPKLKFGVVQGNFGIYTYTSPLKSALLADMQRVTADLEGQGAEVGLWGETAYPYISFARESRRDLPEAHPRRVRRGFSIPLVLGLMTMDHTGTNPYPWNTAWVLGEDGTLGDRYDKVYPLMFGESVPLVDPEWYLRQVPSASYLNTGDGPGVLEVRGYRLAPLICYEDILPRFGRQAANQGVHAIVNLTNDSWFGNTAEQWEHLGLAVFRSVEHRKPLVRSVNAGVSAYVDPAGRVVHQTRVTDSDTEGWDGAEGFLAEVPMMDPESRTVYGRLGDTLNGVFAVALVALGWRRREGQDAPSGTDECAPADA